MLLQEQGHFGPRTGASHGIVHVGAPGYTTQRQPYNGCIIIDCRSAAHSTITAEGPGHGDAQRRGGRGAEDVTRWHEQASRAVVRDRGSHPRTKGRAQVTRVGQRSAQMDRFLQ